MNTFCNAVTFYGYHSFKTINYHRTLGKNAERRIIHLIHINGMNFLGSIPLISIAVGILRLSIQAFNLAFNPESRFQPKTYIQLFRGAMELSGVLGVLFIFVDIPITIIRFIYIYNIHKPTIEINPEAHGFPA